MSARAQKNAIGLALALRDLHLLALAASGLAVEIDETAKDRSACSTAREFAIELRGAVRRLDSLLGVKAVA